MIARTSAKSSYRDAWYPGKQEPIIDRPTWNRVQSLLGIGNNQSHTMTYAAGLIQCGHCGHQITGEVKDQEDEERRALVRVLLLHPLSDAEAIRKLG